jgi:hypothetical protein
MLAAVALCLTATAARADRLVAGGVTLSGSVKSVTSAGVEFQPEFAKDPMLVPWDKVEDLSSDASFQVLYGDELEVVAPIGGFSDGKLEFGDAKVDPKTELVAATGLGEAEPGFRDRVRSAMRYWHGAFDLGFNVQQATIDNLGLLVALRTMRAKGPTRLMLGADYRYATERNPDNAPPKERRTKDSASGLVRGEYDLTKYLYVYGSTDALYDAVQNLSLRAVPKAGLGFVVWQREPKEGVRDFLALEAGAGWVYESYMCGAPGDCAIAPSGKVVDEDDYFTIALGAAAAVVLPRGMAFDWRFDYLPSVQDFADDYVVRTAAALTVPLIAPVSARLSIADTYDSTPAGDADENSLLVDTSLNVAW